jgi:hypothetical protein
VHTVWAVNSTPDSILEDTPGWRGQVRKNTRRRDKFCETSTPAATPPRNQSYFTGFVNVGKCVKLSLRAGVADFAPIVLWSYSGCRNRLVLSMTKRVSALASERDKDFTRARVHAGVLYFEAERE